MNSRSTAYKRRRISLSDGFWCENSRSKLIEEFGPKTNLGRIDKNRSLSQYVELYAHRKAELSESHVRYYQKRDQRFAVVQILGFSDYIILGLGRTAKDALIDAGLSTWVKSTELNELAKT